MNNKYLISMSLKPMKNNYHLSFLPFTLANQTIFINYKPAHSVQQISVDSYFHLYNIIERNPQKEIILFCEEENIAQTKASWFYFMEQQKKKKEKLQDELLLDGIKIKQKIDNIEPNLEANLIKMMDKLTKKVYKKIESSKFENQLQQLRKEKNQYEQRLQQKTEQLNNKNSRKIRKEIKFLQKNIEKIQERKKLFCLAQKSEQIEEKRDKSNGTHEEEDDLLLQ